MRPTAQQHPKITVAWATASMERALTALGDSPAEERVRRQFHQLLLALERDGYAFLDARLFPVKPPTARIIPMPPRSSQTG